MLALTVLLTSRYCLKCSKEDIEVSRRFRKQIVINNTMGDTNGNICNGDHAAIQGNWIYYPTPINFEAYKEDSIRKVQANGKDGQKVADVYAKYINVVDDWSYYSESVLDDEGNETVNICKVKTDGSKRTVLCEESGYYLHVVDGWIDFT
ncbi:MAG: DUF5050 domain-containing protein [Clostridia bacterium]|nr:DUF5050 domain-containing protein [Clostridia bacterium]